MLARFSVDTHSIPKQVVYFQLNLERFRVDTVCEIKGTGQLGFLEGLSENHLAPIMPSYAVGTGRTGCSACSMTDLETLKLPTR
jgi:hypothetical protein